MFLTGSAGKDESALDLSGYAIAASLVWGS
jgi:hypothetical protein